MAKLKWDQAGSKFYETGVSNGVLFVKNDGEYGQGVAWNGLISVSENPSGGEPQALYADNIKYLNLLSNEEFGASIEAYTYPDEFAACDGSVALGEGATPGGILIGQQPRKEFALVYKTLLGNDAKGNDFGYRLHVIYGALAAPSQKQYQTVNDSPEAITFSWDITTTPVPVTGHKPTASIVIDSTKVGASNMKNIEDALFGSDEMFRSADGEGVSLIRGDGNPKLLMPDEIIALAAGE